MTAPMNPILSLSKHHGAGNDFLVLVDEGRSWRVDGTWARKLCDRHRGIGADGFIRVTPGPESHGGGADLVMELWNADGSRAEMSGNGMRTLAQAAVRAGLVGDHFVVATDGGLKVVDFTPGEQPGAAWVEVGMGPARLGPAGQVDDAGRAVRWVDMGNPHLVVFVDDPDRVDIDAYAGVVQTAYPGGINVEFVTRLGPDALAMRVWERGVGETLACGTGTCAAAAAAREIGLVAGERVGVRNPGGTLAVTFTRNGSDNGRSSESGPGDQELVLGGPVEQVATVTVDVAWLENGSA